MWGNLDSGIRENCSCGIRNPRLWYTSQGIRIPPDDWNPESKFYWQRMECSTWNLESTAWNPESKTFLDFLHGTRLIEVLMRVDHIVKALLICIKRVLSITVRDILVSAGIIFRFIIRLFVLILIFIPSRFIKKTGKQQIFSILLGKITCKIENSEFTSKGGAHRLQKEWPAGNAAPWKWTLQQMLSLSIKTRIYMCLAELGLKWFKIIHIMVK